MLKVSTKGRYGLRTIAALAEYYNKGPVHREVIAKEQNISKKYIHNILTLLRDKGFVRAVRGKEGGFTLAKHPSQISLLEIIEALEGPIALVDCVCDRKVCNRSSRCLTINLWEDLSSMIKKCLGSMSLESFIRDYSRRLKTK